MAFARPTLNDLIEQQRAVFATRLPGADSRLRRSILDVLARAFAGALFGLYGFLAYIADQIFPDTAELENLERWASIFALQRLAAEFAGGSAQATGVNGSVLPTGSIFRRSDGLEFESTAEVAISGGVVSVPLTARLAGASGNTDDPSVLSLLSPLAGVDSSLTVEAPGISGGSDREDDDSLRARVLERIRRPPMGGAAQDYKTWAKLVAGVTRVWVSLGANPGEVQVLFVRDDDASIIPDAGEVTAVADMIELFRPVTANVIVLAPTLTAQNFTIQLLPDTPSIRLAVEASLEDLFRRESAPGATIPISHVREAISVAAGEVDHVLSSPTIDIVIGATNVLEVGTITWT